MLNMLFYVLCCQAAGGGGGGTVQSGMDYTTTGGTGYQADYGLTPIQSQVRYEAGVSPCL